MAGTIITGILIVDGVSLPAPSSYRVTRNDLDGSGTQRSENGTLYRDRIRGGVYTIEVGWESISVSELSALTAAFSPVKISVSFFDLTTCSHVTEQMYAANPAAEVTTPANNTNDMKCSYNVSLVQF